jgi:uroporphyrinogen-III synthase
VDRPLAGRRLLLTRRPEQARELAARLIAQGAEVIEVPLLAVAPPADAGPLERALAGLERYDWIAFTSANAVEAFAGALERAARALPAAVRLASVGPSTTAALRERLGRQPALEPTSQYRAEGLLCGFDAHDVAGLRILLPLSDLARDTLAAGLRARGAVVDAVVAYRTVMPPESREELERALSERIDLVLLASPSAVEGLRAVLGDRAGGLPCVVIGPVTEQAARSAGLQVRAVAGSSTAAGLVEVVTRELVPSSEQR